MSQYVSDATSATFSQEVLERSTHTPVLVDFWAEWCGPCRTLGPVLEAAVEARNGAVWMVKVDTDANHDLSLQYGIRGIPAVLAFVQGKVAGEFVGVRDRRAVDVFIDGVCPSAEQTALACAEQLLSQGRAAGVPELLLPCLDSARHCDDARLLLARAHVAAGDYHAADEALASIDDRSLAAGRADGVQARLELLRAADGKSPEGLRQAVETNPDDHAARWSLAGTLLRAGAHEQALEELLELLQRAGRGLHEDGVRRAMLAIFDEVGQEDDISREYRRKLQIYL